MQHQTVASEVRRFGSQHTVGTHMIQLKLGRSGISAMARWEIFWGPQICWAQRWKKSEIKINSQVHSAWIWVFHRYTIWASSSPKLVCFKGCVPSIQERVVATPWFYLFPYYTLYWITWNHLPASPAEPMLKQWGSLGSCWRLSQWWNNQRY